MSMGVGEDIWGKNNCDENRCHGRFVRGFLVSLVMTTFLVVSSSAFGASPAEVEFLRCEGFHQTSIGPFFGLVASNGLETSWQFESAPSEGGPWQLIPGDDGTFPSGEARVEGANELTGLTAETTYYIRLTATNSAGGTSKIIQCATRTTHPEAFAPQAGGIEANSVRVTAGIVPSNFETDWHFEFATTANELEKGHGLEGTKGVITQAEANESYHEVSGELTGLAANTTYYVEAVALNAHGEAKSSITSFTTAGPPAVTTFAVHAINGEVMRALGSVRPDGYDTHYYAEYISQKQFEANGWAGASKTSAEDAGTGEFVGGVFPTKLVGLDLSGLQAGTVYHYRFVAESTAPGDPIVDGDEQSLSMPDSSPEFQPSCPNEALRGGHSAHLPDCRAYEQVTPIGKEGAEDAFKYGLTGEGSLVGEDGEHFALHAPGVQWGADPDVRIANYFFDRTASGWQMTSMRPQGESGPDSYLPFLFNPDLTEVGLEAEWHLSGASSSPDIEFKTGPPGGPYQTVVSVPRSFVEQEHAWIAASEDMSKMILGTNDYALLDKATGTESGNDLYEFSGGILRQVNVSSGGSTIGTCGARMAAGFEGYEGRGDKAQSSPHAVSADGSHVFFEAVPGSNCSESRNLYVRTDGDKTADLGSYVFLAANREGSKLLLERQAGETHEYVLFNTEEMTSEPLFTTSDEIFVEGGGGFPVVSADLTTLYFFSNEQLTSDAPPVVSETGTQPQNLYRYDIPQRKLEFVAQSGGNSGGGFKGHSTSRDGRYFYWITTAVAGVPGGSGGSEQVYRYDSSEGVIQCMSCSSAFDPHPKLNATFLETGTMQTSDGVPEMTDASSDGDYVFFDSPSELVLEDIDGEIAPEEPTQDNASSNFSVSSDVYEWRKDGIDGCGHLQGCLALITAGNGGYKNEFLGTTESGRDVFFATHESLVSEDRDSAGDVYDAREGGGFATAPPGPVECAGDACRIPVTAPVDTTPASLSFVGPGDATSTSLQGVTSGNGKSRAKPCPKGSVRKGKRCVKKRRNSRPGRGKKSKNRNRGNRK